MYNSSVATQEPGPVYDLVSRLGRFAFSSGPHSSSGSDGHSSFLSNFLYFDAFGGASGAGTKPKVGVSASLSLSSRGGSGIRRVVTEFNRAIRFHCDRFPIGFASVRVGSGDGNGSDNGVGDNNNVFIEDGGGVNDNGIALNGVEAESPKKVLILMSDTGGGHRASAEVIKAAFNEEFGDEYQEEDLPAVLLMGGGEGMGPIEATARALGDALYDENLGEPVGRSRNYCRSHDKRPPNYSERLHWYIWYIW